jgi:Zn-dependent alcohol dehydrogenase
MDVRAAVLHEARTPLSVETVTLDPPRAGEVLVRVAAAGVCHSDVRLADGDLGEGRWPTVLGHEGAGVIEAVGPEAGGHVPGDRVAFCFVPPCRACGACAAGRFNLCEVAAAHAWAGTMLDGTTRLRLADGRPVRHFNFVSCFAEHCVLPAASAVPIPPELPLWQAALLGCAVVTGFGAVRNAARVSIGESVCVIGCGGIGQQIVAAARMAGAGRIVAVDRDSRSSRAGSTMRSRPSATLLRSGSRGTSCAPAARRSSWASRRAARRRACPRSTCSPRRRCAAATTGRATRPWRSRGSGASWPTAASPSPTPSRT